MPGSWARCKPAGTVGGEGKDVTKGNGSCTHDLPHPWSHPGLQHDPAWAFSEVLCFVHSDLHLPLATFLSSLTLWQCLCCQNFLGCASPSSQEGLYPTVHFFNLLPKWPSATEENYVNILVIRPQIYSWLLIHSLPGSYSGPDSPFSLAYIHFTISITVPYNPTYLTLNQLCIGNFAHIPRVNRSHNPGIPLISLPSLLSISVETLILPSRNTFSSLYAWHLSSIHVFSPCSAC